MPLWPKAALLSPLGVSRASAYRLRPWGRKAAFHREAFHHPVGHHGRRIGPEIDRCGGPDGVAGVLVDDKAPRRRHPGQHAFGMHQRAELLGLAGDAQIGHADLLDMALPGQGLPELVEGRLVGEARHVHEALLEGRRGLLEDRMKAGLEAGRIGDTGHDARLVCSDDGGEERAEAVAENADAGGIDLGPRQQPVDHNFADRGPVLHAHREAEQAAFRLARTVERQHRDAAAEPAVAAEADEQLLEGVHAGKRDHDRDLSALVARRQMEPARNCFAAERQEHRLDAVIRQTRIVAVTGALVRVEGEVLGIVGV